MIDKNQLTDEQQHSIAPCILVLDLSKRVEIMDAKIQQLDVQGAILQTLMSGIDKTISKNNDTMEKFSETLNSIEKTMLGMQLEIKNQSESSMRIEIKVKDIEKRFSESEEKAKTDFRVIFKNFIDNKLVYILSGGGIIFLIIEIIRYLSK